MFMRGLLERVQSAGIAILDWLGFPVRQRRLRAKMTELIARHNKVAERCGQGDIFDVMRQARLIHLRKAIDCLDQAEKLSKPWLEQSGKMPDRVFTEAMRLLDTGLAEIEQAGNLTPEQALREVDEFWAGFKGVRYVATICGAGTLLIDRGTGTVAIDGSQPARVYGGGLFYISGKADIDVKGSVFLNTEKALSWSEQARSVKIKGRGQSCLIMGPFWKDEPGSREVILQLSGPAVFEAAGWDCVQVSRGATLFATDCALIRYWEGEATVHAERCSRVEKLAPGELAPLKG